MSVLEAPAARTLSGSEFPLGATVSGIGTNFAVASCVADGMLLCLFDETGKRLPVMISVTLFPQGGGRTMTGQSLEAFWIAIAHFDMLSAGINCAVGIRDMRPWMET